MSGHVDFWGASGPTGISWSIALFRAIDTIPTIAILAVDSITTPQSIPFNEYLMLG